VVNMCVCYSVYLVDTCARIKTGDKIICEFGEYVSVKQIEFGRQKKMQSK